MIGYIMARTSNIR